MLIGEIMLSQTFLIEFDACLDTRLGTLSRISQEGVMAVMRNGYWRRDTDNFEELSGGLITNEQYKEMYAKRDVETLKASVVTRLFDLIGPMSKELMRRQAEQVEIGEIIVKVNFYPYVLPDEDKQLILDLLATMMAIVTKFKHCYIPIDQLTPRTIDRLADIYIMYNYDEWFTLHHESFKTEHYPMMAVMVPKIMHNKEQLTEELKIDPETGQERDPWHLHQLILAEYLSVDFQPAFIYSSVT
jgi:hypothetical protein